MQLHKAVHKSDIKELQRHLSKGLDVNEMDSLGRTALHIACQKGETDMVKLLLTQFMIHPRVKDSVGWTPLYYACSSGQIEVINILLDDNRTDKNLYHLFLSSISYLFKDLPDYRALEVCKTLLQHERTYFVIHQATDCLIRLHRDTNVALDVGYLMCTEKNIHPDELLPDPKHENLLLEIKQRIRLHRSKSARGH